MFHIANISQTKVTTEKQKQIVSLQRFHMLTVFSDTEPKTQKPFET